MALGSRVRLMGLSCDVSTVNSCGRRLWSRLWIRLWIGPGIQPGTVKRVSASADRFRGKYG